MTENASKDRLYVYCVIEGNPKLEFGEIGIGNKPETVYTISYREISAVVSKCDSQNYERTDENVIAHQRVVQKIFDRHQGIPLSFSTVLAGEDRVKELLQSRYEEFRDKLDRMSEILSSPDGASGSLPERELVEEALAQSFASSLRIRQLSDELGKLKASSNEQLGDLGQPDPKVLEEIRALKQEFARLLDVASNKISDMRVAEHRDELAPETKEIQGGVAHATEVLEELRALKQELAHLRVSSGDEIKDIKQPEDSGRVLDEIRAIRAELSELRNVLKTNGRPAVDSGSDVEVIDNVAGLREEFDRIKASYAQLESIQGEITHLVEGMVPSGLVTDTNVGGTAPSANDNHQNMHRAGLLTGLRHKIGRVRPSRIS